MLFEDAGEVARVVKSDGECHIGDTPIGIFQESLRFSHTIPVKVLDRRHSRLTFEKTAKVVLVQMKERCQGCRCNMLMTVMRNICDDLAHAARLVFLGKRALLGKRFCPIATKQAAEQAVSDGLDFHISAQRLLGLDTRDLLEAFPYRPVAQNQRHKQNVIKAHIAKKAGDKRIQ